MKGITDWYLNLGEVPVKAAVIIGACMVAWWIGFAISGDTTTFPSILVVLTALGFVKLDYWKEDKDASEDK